MKLTATTLLTTAVWALMGFATLTSAVPANTKENLHLRAADAYADADGIENVKRSPFRGDKYAKYWPGRMGPQADGFVDDDEDGEMEHVQKRDAAPFRGDKYAKYWPGRMGPAAEE